MPSNVLRNLPSVSELLENPHLKTLIEKVNRNTVVSKAKSLLDDLRHEVQTAATEIIVPGVTELAEKIAQHILQTEQLGLRGVVNATGVILHSSLGRTPLAEEALAAMLTRPDMREKLEALGLSITPPEQRSPEYLAKYLPQEIERWGKVIRAGAISMD